MTVLFVDTAAWIGLTDTSDQYHEPARRFYRASAASAARLLTSSLVLAESYALLRRVLPTHRAVDWLDQLLSSSRLEVVYDTPEILRRALRFLTRYADHAFSLVDAVSMQIMHDRDLRAVFTFDPYFHVAGYAVVPGTEGDRFGRGALG